MKRFFGSPSTNWDQLSGRLHVYHVLENDTELSCSMHKVAECLVHDDCVQEQPPAFYHATVQQLGSYVQDWPDSKLNCLIDSLAEAYQSIPQFELDFQMPQAREFAVETLATPNSGWDHLVNATRSVLQTIDCHSFLPVAPFGPHMTVAYGVSSGDNAKLDTSIAQQKDLFPVRHGIEHVDLVAVTQERERGVFAFERLHRFTLL